MRSIWLDKLVCTFVIQHAEIPYLLHFVTQIRGYELAEFCVLSEIHVSKTRFKQINENLLRLKVYERMFWELVYKFSYP